MWEVLHRPLYRGEIVWARTRKRDAWGRHRQTALPESDWLRQSTPALRIATDEQWTAAHHRLAAVRALYLKATKGQAFGRPPIGDPSKYLLTNLALCGACGGTLKVRTRKHGTGRRHFYGCGNYHQRGRAVCANNADIPMGDADAIVLEALLDDVLDPPLLRDSVDEAVRLLRGDRRRRTAADALSGAPGP